jgi:hypothetical protein
MPHNHESKRAGETLIFCLQCNIRMVMNDDGTLPRHWPNSHDLCPNTGSRNHRPDNGTKAARKP